MGWATFWVPFFTQAHLGSMLWSQFSAIFANFRRKIVVFLENQCYNQNFAYFSFVLSQIHQLFRWIFRRKYLKNHNIRPWSPCHERSPELLWHIDRFVRSIRGAHKKMIWDELCWSSFPPPIFFSLIHFSDKIMTKMFCLRSDSWLGNEKKWVT
jgi:hypothetical protein